MCGIAGLLGTRSVHASLMQTAERMASAITHRGPDASGVWADEPAGVALSHRRLSILDLSDAGRQPMRGTRWVLTYNGEIYNFAELRRELEAQGVEFHGSSDTEVLLAAIEEWGVVAAIERAAGMFAFAAWDTRNRELVLGRDRLGIKPLYVARVGDGIAFASEMSAIELLPGFERKLDRAALREYFRFACLPPGECIYRGVEQVTPGELWTYRGAQSVHRRRYWDALTVAQRGLDDPLRGTKTERTERVEHALLEAVRARAVADVPLGVFLSGGIDSSLVTALLQEQSSAPVRSFSIGFESAAYNEADDAARVARHLETAHTELILTPQDAMNEVPGLAAKYSEPFADSSQLPTLLVCQMARRDVTVALSGDGGDEVFGGYNRHLWAQRLRQAQRLLPRQARLGLAHGLTRRTPREWDEMAAQLRTLLPRLEVRTPGDKVHKLAGLLGAGSLDELYLRLTSIWQEPQRIVRGGEGEPTRPPTLRGATAAEQMMLRDLVTYLPNDILTKVDRASMSVSLEVRVPLLDHRVVELAWRLPASDRASKGVGKRVLRRVLGRRVPKALFERPKMGFGVPIDSWLRGPLRSWAEDLLAPDTIRRQGYLDEPTVRACWQEHLQGTSVRQHQLWAILMFQSWLSARS